MLVYTQAGEIIIIIMHCAALAQILLETLPSTPLFLGNLSRCLLLAWTTAIGLTPLLDDFDILIYGNAHNIKSILAKVSHLFYFTN